ncbi:hypothetical protein E2562_022112 [Oryza meyeriana var. granulata]|uniref:Uncharacterized protein n=1 Tax=Oryza meyeriana var. granulata TaxID=110450 RepID=A0A6G1ENU8_9ORYZ|nr:hypothetical protein E2562_022112 [Oryza meyeriana var. granulata]
MAVAELSEEQCDNGSGGLWDAKLELHPARMAPSSSSLASASSPPLSVQPRRHLRRTAPLRHAPLAWLHELDKVAVAQPFAPQLPHPPPLPAPPPTMPRSRTVAVPLLAAKRWPSWKSRRSTPASCACSSPRGAKWQSQGSLISSPRFTPPSSAGPAPPQSYRLHSASPPLPSPRLTPARAGSAAPMTREVARARFSDDTAYSAR